MMIETILAVLAVVSFLSATVMAMFAWKINSDWCQICGKMLEYMQDEHMMMAAMMGEWYETEIEDEDTK